MYSTGLYAIAGLFYLISGGRVSIVLALGVLYYIASADKSSKRKSPNSTGATKSGITSKSKKSPNRSKIYEVDFTTTSFPPKQLITSSKAIPLRRKRDLKVFKGKKTKTPDVRQPVLTNASIIESQLYIFYTTTTGTSKRLANELYEKLSNIGDLKSKPKLMSLDEDVDDLEEYFLKSPGDKDLYVLVLPSYETDSPIDYFLEHLQETHNDFRVDKYPMKKIFGFSILGIGDSESWAGEKFCYQAKLADKWLGKLGARRIFPLGQVCVKYEGESKASSWIDKFCETIQDKEPIVFDENDLDLESDTEASPGSGSGSDDLDDGETLVDVEDMGRIIKGSSDLEVKEMVAENSPTFKTLTKQGYTIVGSHSGVKICRWTKSALRGRGSCYKYAFYGIRSHLCMETTPSLACSNKCVFCWRHGTNPVAKSTWRWELDPPEKVVEGALQGHYKKIKQLRGVPGIQMDRFDEAFRVRHCALSLVGEPIFYPHINGLLKLLHDKQISSFLVCNAQHPDQLAQLERVTQLYVSIDAPTKTELKKIDRPLNSDFWERLNSCLDILRTTQSHQRTVFRLTLVKGFNMNEAEGYADMVAKANPSQIEVKGATFCGSSAANGNPLTMQNIPFYEECQKFVIKLTKLLRARGLMYDLAAEHAHSCCILIAHDKFKINGRWHTHIDYPKYFELLESGVSFNDLDYVKETPEWALWGSEGAGFNPKDTKFDRKAEKLKRKQKREALVEI